MASRYGRGAVGDRGFLAWLLAAVLGTASCVPGVGVAATRPGGEPARGRGPDLTPESRVLVGGVVDAAKAAADTIYVLGGPGQLSGKFELADHATPDAQGWSGVDLTAPPLPHWQVSTFNAADLDPGRAGNLAMWCGALFTPCNAQDPPQGYGNNWDDWLDWRGTVPDNTLPTTVRVQAVANTDCEPGYDLLTLQVERAMGMVIEATWTGSNGSANFVFTTPVVVDQTFAVAPADYLGAMHNQVHLRFAATADGGYSDEDCLYPSAGHSQIDNISVSFNGVAQTLDDFEPGSAQHWTPVVKSGSGNFAKVWPRLYDADPCRENPTPQWAFIDDGVVVPGTGGTLGVTWTYGPGGYAVNPAAGWELGLHCEVWSPPLIWPDAGHDGARLSFDVYDHMLFGNNLYWVWHVRSSNDGGVTWSAWRDRGFVYGSATPKYYRFADTASDLLPAGRNRVQVALGVRRTGWCWGCIPDPTPAPYFDNVSLAAYSYAGPAITAREIDLFQSAFPASGTLDYANLGNNSVRLDMARNISPRADLRNDPGDSLVLTVAPVRAGSVLVGRPRLVVRMKPNLLFDAVRALPAGFARNGRFIDGVVYGDTAYARPANTPVTDTWAFDLPDTGFFYPGDAIHYFVEAQDIVGGDVGTTRLPADTTGFALFHPHAGYHSLSYEGAFKVRALPSLFTAIAGSQPRMLLWDDYANRSGGEEWSGALDRLAAREGVEYDLYYTLGPSSGVGNGLGGRATPAQLAGYATMLYTCGDLSSWTLSNGDFNGDPGNDVGLLDAWLGQGGKGLFATGNDLEYDLSRSGTAGTAFRNKWLAVTHNARDVRPLIGTQSTPLVKPIPGNAPGLSYNFVAYGGCTPIRNFNAVTATGTGVRVAEFTNAAGAGGAYPYAALIYNSVPASTARVVWSPVDFMNWYNPQGARGNIRANLLAQVLLFFGNILIGETAVPDAATFAVKAYPNPFNPSVRIAYALPARGELSLKLYDVRGRLVRVLRDGVTEAGPGTVTWDGRDGGGAGCASGVYFCEAKGGGQSVVEKLTLVR